MLKNCKGVWCEDRTRYSLVKGERIIESCTILAPILYKIGSSDQTSDFCILFESRVAQTTTGDPSGACSLKMSDEQLKLVASGTINALFSSGKVSTPIGSMDLLTRVIANGPPPGLLPSPPPRFRLTDLSKFDSILENLSQNWEYGTISVTRDDVGLTVMDISLGSPGSVNPLATLTSRKRKRVVDEDADSAAGNEEEQESLEAPFPGSTTLGNLSKELKEVYTILQRSTAKGRLLAEQV